MSTDRSRPVYLVATDGGESSAGALRLGMLAAEQSGAQVELVTVGDRTAGARVRTLVDGLSSAPWSWSHVHFPGSLAPGLAHAAAERRATMVMLGVALTSGRNVAAELATMVEVPVVAVPTQSRTLPRRALLAIDFGRASVNAASVALGLLARPAHALMVSVLGMSESDSHLDILFDAVQDRLASAQEVAIARHRGSGDTVDTILRLASAQEADLITVGCCGRWSHGTRNRAIGHVTKRIFDAATCTVLAAPAPS